ncbi:MAG TPA: hypothetical protein VJZ26_01495 [Blastocatellia bacterium]|nr:hypothetical protein [Blastocatellia bacterium]
MKSNSARWSILLLLVFCVTALAESAPVALTAFKPPRAQDGAGAIEPVNFGDIAAGSIAAPAGGGSCSLGETQYRIEFPGGARTVEIELNASQASQLYVRRGVPIAVGTGGIVADSRSVTSAKIQRFRLPLPSFLRERSPLLPATFFVAVANCGAGAADYTLSAKLAGPPDAETVRLDINDVTVGSVPAPEPGFCRLSRTQYTIFNSFDPCSGGTTQGATVFADQNVNVYVRAGRPVTEENGIVTYDTVTRSQEKFHFVGPAGSGVSFVAIENCGFSKVDYALVSSLLIGDVFPPIIAQAFFVKKDLHVIGFLFPRPGTVYFDGQPQETISGGQTSDFRDILIVKKAKKKIAHNQTVRLTLSPPDAPCPPLVFIFTRP